MEYCYAAFGCNSKSDYAKKIRLSFHQFATDAALLKATTVQPIVPQAKLKPKDSKRDVQVRAKINQKLTETGEKERLEEMLRQNLVECGWRDELKIYCREIVQERGVDNVTVEELVADITPKARAMVPDEVKRELLQKIRNFLTEKAEVGS